MTWWLKKWNGSSPIRVATGGLAASDSMMPASISAMIAASSRRSTVHHHSLKGVRCSRESMGCPLGQRSVHWSPMMVSKGLTGTIIFWGLSGLEGPTGRHAPDTGSAAPPPHETSLWAASAFARPRRTRRRCAGTSAISRHVAPEFCNFMPEIERAPPTSREGAVLPQEAGNAGCPMHPWPHKCGSRPQVHRSQPAFPAQWLYGFFRALPGDRLCCHRHP